MQYSGKDNESKGYCKDCRDLHINFLYTVTSNYKVIKDFRFDKSEGRLNTS